MFQDEDKVAVVGHMQALGSGLEVTWSGQRVELRVRDLGDDVDDELH